MPTLQSRKSARPSRLRTRLAIAFGFFALSVVAVLGVLEIVFWDAMHPGGVQTQIIPVLVTAGALVVTVAALAGWLLAGPLARPMEKWAEAADRIGVGERNVSFPAAGGSHELARVSAALQSMFARVSEKEDLLQARVRERTAALDAAIVELAAERERLSHAMEGSQIAFWDMDLETGAVHLSTEWARMLGEPQGETVTNVQALLERVPEEEHVAISERGFGALKGGGADYDLDHRVRHADGSWIWIRSRGRVTERAADGRALRMVGTNVDIAARKAHEQRHQETEARLRAMLDGFKA